MEDDSRGSHPIQLASAHYKYEIAAGMFEKLPDYPESKLGVHVLPSGRVEVRIKSVLPDHFAASKIRNLDEALAESAHAPG